MPRTIESERDLFERKLQELYELEQELDDLQPRLAEEAIDEDIEEFFMAHHGATEEQLDRIEAMFEAVNAEPETRERTIVEDVVTERESYLEDTTNLGLQDVIDVETARAIERLEITKLETLLALANRLDLESDVQESIRTSVTEAENALQTLTEMQPA